MPRDEYPQSTGLKPSVSCLRLPGQLCLCPEACALHASFWGPGRGSEAPGCLGLGSQKLDTEVEAGAEEGRGERQDLAGGEPSWEGSS